MTEKTVITESGWKLEFHGRGVHVLAPWSGEEVAYWRLGTTAETVAAMDSWAAKEEADHGAF